MDVFDVDVDLKKVSSEFLLRVIVSPLTTNAARDLIADELNARLKKAESVNEKVKGWLAEIEADERLHYPTATVFENAPLALVQCGLENQRRALKLVLSALA